MTLRPAESAAATTSASRMPGDDPLPGDPDHPGDVEPGGRSEVDHGGAGGPLHQS